MVNYKNMYFNTDKKRLYIKQCYPSDLNNLGDMDVEEIVIWNLIIHNNEKINNLPITLKVLKINKAYIDKVDFKGGWREYNKYRRDTVINNTKLPHNCILELIK